MYSMMHSTPVNCCIVYVKRGLEQRLVQYLLMSIMKKTNSTGFSDFGKGTGSKITLYNDVLEV